MAAEFDEYAYLEQQVTAPPAGDAAPEPAPCSQKDEHKEKPRSSDRDKDRERDRDRDRSKKSRDRSRDRDREKSSRRSRHRSRSRSRSRRHRTRSRSRDRRHHRHSRSPPRRRERTPPEVRIAREKERELRELERATRTIFCYQLNLRAEEKDLFDFFSKVGTVTDIKLISDRHTRKSKGMAYIEFRNQEDAFKAVALNGVANFMNLPLCVKSAEAEKNLAWEVQQQAKQTQATLQQVATTGPCKLQILNLHAELTDADVKPLFEPFGPVLSVQIIRDAAGNSMRYGYVTFQTTTDGERAAQHWNGQVVRDLVIAVSVANHLDVAAAAASHLAADTDGDENLKLSAQARAHLMSRLAASAGLQQPKQPTTPDGGIAGAMPQLGGLAPAAGAAAAPPPAVDAEVLLEQGLLGPASPIPTQCLLLKNMFDPQELQDPAAEAEVTQDVVEECGKFGRVLHCFVDKNSKGFVYLKFEAVEGAQAAAQALHGRWYSGHQIVAEYQFMQIYAAYFKV